MPVEISDWNDLDNVRNDLTGDYVLVNDLDENTDGYAGIGDDFEPIGFIEDDDFTSEFAGSFDGRGFSISDVVIELGGFGVDGDIGFFASTDTGSLIENLSVDGGVTVTDSGRFNYGGLVGNHVGGTIQNCASHVDVTALDGTRVGGLVGYNDATVTDSYATGSVEGDSPVGGLVGENDATVTDSYAAGSVEGDDRVGGLVGYNETGSSVTDSYAAGSVEGDDRAGGLVGENRDTIQTSYAVGLVTGNGTVGALVGENGNGDEIDSSYADEETTGQTDLIGSTGGDVINSETLTTAEMQGSEAETNMDGFDFADVWFLVVKDEIIEDTTPDEDGYPILQSVDEADQLNAQNITFTEFTLTVETNAATGISAFSATLNGELVELDDEADDADVFFEFGEDVTDSQTAIQTLTETATFDDVIDELTNNTTFEFRAVAEAQGEDGNTFTDEGGVLTFTTDDTQIDVQTNAATDVEAFSAVLNGEVVDIGEYDGAETFFEYGQVSLTDNSTDVVTVGGDEEFSGAARPFESDSDVVEYRAVVIGENDGSRFEGDALTFSTTTATVSGVINPDAPAEGAVVDVRNKTKDESYGRDRTGSDGEYSLNSISGAEVGDMLEILVDVKREGDINVSRAIYPTFGTELPNE